MMDVAESPVSLAMLSASLPRKSSNSVDEPGAGVRPAACSAAARACWGRGPWPGAAAAADAGGPGGGVPGVPSRPGDRCGESDLGGCDDVVCWPPWCGDSGVLGGVGGCDGGLDSLCCAAAARARLRLSAPIAPMAPPPADSASRILPATADRAER